MGWKQRPTEIKKLTRMLAITFSEMRPPPGERPLSNARMKILRKEVDSGNFTSPRWGVAHCKGKSYRVNGQHTSKLLSDGFPEGMEVIIESFDCDSLDDVSRVYASYDSLASARKFNDITVSIAGGIDGMEDVPRKVLIYSVSGLSMLDAERRFVGPSATGGMSYEIRSRLIRDNREDILMVDGILDTRNVKTKVASLKLNRMLSGAVLAAMFTTIRANREHARMFWSLVKTDDATDAEHPTRQLAVILGADRKVTQSGRPSSLYMPNAAGKRAIYMQCLFAWNAYMTGSNKVRMFRENSIMPDPIRWRASLDTGNS